MNLKQGIRLLIFAILIIAAALGLFSHGGSWSDNFVFRLMAAIPFSITFFVAVVLKDNAGAMQLWAIYVLVLE